jgi:K+-transporting ATPase KdpF subunit
MPSVAIFSSSRDETMLFDYILGGAVTAVLLTYLVYALLRPEKF